MDIYFANRKLEVLGMASTELPDSYLLYKDSETFSITEGVSVFEGYIPFVKGTRRDINRTVKVGNYILFENEEKESKYYTIIRTEKDRKNDEIYFYAEDAGMDLLNEIAEPFEADNAYSAAWYINKYLEDSGFEIGVNEIPELSRKLKWEGETTVTKRLLSIATQFDNSEISYSFDFAEYAIQRKYINIYKKRGTRSMIELSLDREVDNIVTTETIEELATALKCYGATPEGADSPITLEGYNYDDGRFFIDGSVLKDRQSNAKWTRYLSENGTSDGYLTRTFSHEGATTQAELLNRALEKLKIISEIEINFEVSIVDFNEKIQIGDTVSAIDDEDELYLEARVLKLSRSRSNESYEATLGDYLITESGIDNQIQDLANKIANIKDGKDGDTIYLWIRYADDDKGTGLNASSLGKPYMAIKHVLNDPSASDDPKDYDGLWTKFVGDPGKNGADGEQGPKGEQGSTGAIGPSGPAGPRGPMGIAYYQPTAPTGLIEPGATWFKTQGMDDLTVIGISTFTDGKWEPTPIANTALVVEKLSALSADLGNVTAGTLQGVQLINVFKDVYHNGALLSGTTTIADAKYRMDGTTNSNQAFVTELNPIALSGIIYSDKDKKETLNSYSLSSSGLTFYDKSYGSGSVSAQYLVDYPWWYLGLNGGYSWYDTSTNKYRPKAKLIYIGPNPFLQFFGIVIRNSSGGGGGGWQAFGSLNLEAMKVKQFMTADANMTVSVGNGDGATLGLQTSGGMVMRTPSNWTEMRIGGLMPLT